ncbi:MAG: hypothetical protein ACNA7I_08885, partial [Candidatus Methanoperedens sp.]
YGSGENAYMDVDLLDRSINLTYKRVIVGATQGDCTQIKSNVFNSSAWTWLGVNENEEKSLYDIMQHYTSEFAPELSLKRCSPGQSDHVDYEDSTMLLNYTPSGALTYLHISDNRADVAIS